MKTCLLCLCLLLTLAGCVQEEEPAETIPVDLQTMPPETEAPEPLPPPETQEPAAAVLIPAAAEQPVPAIAEADAVIYTEPSFVPAELFLTELGDMVLDPEGYYYFQKDESIEIEYSCGITMDLPASWEVGGTTAADIPRRDAGIYSNKRMEYYNFLYRDTESDVLFQEKVTPGGLSYRYWTSTGSTMDRLGVVWHHCEFPVQMGETFYFHIYFLTFSDDPEDYFALHIQPILDSMVFSVNQ